MPLAVHARMRHPCRQTIGTGAWVNYRIARYLYATTEGQVVSQRRMSGKVGSFTNEDLN